MTPKEATPLRVLLAFAAVYLIWGSTYLGIRYAVETIPPFLMAGTRFVIAGAILYAWLRARGARRPARRDWRVGAITGALMLLGGNGLLSWSEQYLASSLAALLVTMAPFWLVLFAWLGSRGEPPRLLETIGLLVGLGGVVLLLGPQGGASREELHLPAALVLLAGTALWAGGSIYSRRVSLPAPPLLGTAITMLCGGVLLLVVGLGAGELGRLDASAFSLKSLAALGYLIVLGSLIAFSAYAWLIRNVRPALVGTYAYVNPVVAVLLGWGLASEPVTGRTLGAMAVILVGVVLVERGRRAARRAEGPPAAADCRTARRTSGAVG